MADAILEEINPTTFDRYQTLLYKALLNVSAKRNNELSSKEVPFYRMIDSTAARKMDQLSGKILPKINQMISTADLPGSESFCEITEAEDVESWSKDFVSLVDSLIDGVNVSLDEFSGRSKKISTAVNRSKPVIAEISNTRSKDIRFLYGNVIGRPQLKFKNKVDNTSAPFIPKLVEKPNALVPWEIDIEKSKNLSSYLHPYEYEIKKINYPPFIFEDKEPTLYKPIIDSSHIWVETLEDLTAMCEKLENFNEIAVDLEHHDYRSYQGFTCLIQISTREDDFIVDTLALRDSLQMLNQFFTNPNIVKVFHGAEFDIVWLQKDFGVYVVNLFDTFHASSLLELPQKSLSYLLKHYCDVETDKKYQLADWRIRPIPTEMLHYARSDTHYLLYIYDRMRNELITNSDPTTLNLLRVTLERSAETSLKTYQKLVYNENGEGTGGYKKLQERHNKSSFDYQQFAVFKTLHAWRDQIAREEDESTGYVLPNEMLITLSERMSDDPKDITACFRMGVPSLVRMNILELSRLIRDAKSNAQIPISIPTQSENMDVDLTESIDKPMPMTIELNDSLLKTPHVKDVSKYKSKTSMLFGNCLDEPIVQDEKLMKKALEITSFLSFSLPVPKSIDYLNKPTSDTSHSNIPQSPTEILFTSAEQRTTKTTKKDLIMSSSKGKEREIAGNIKGKEREIVEVSISKSSKKRRNMDEEDGVDSVEEVGPATIDESLPTRNKRITPTQLAINTHNNKVNQEVAQNTKGNNSQSNIPKRSKKKNKKAKLMMSDKTETNGELDNKTLTTTDHTELPTATSRLINSVSSATSVDTSSSSTRKTVETKQKTASIKTPFNPYSQTVIDERFKKSDPRLPTAPSSGNRSMTMDRSSNYQEDYNDPDNKCTIM